MTGGGRGGGGGGGGGGEWGGGGRIREDDHALFSQIHLLFKTLCYPTVKLSFSKIFYLDTPKTHLVFHWGPSGALWGPLQAWKRPKHGSNHQIFLYPGPDKVGKQASAACRHRPQFVVLLIVNFVGTKDLQHRLFKADPTSTQGENGYFRHMPTFGNVGNQHDI